MANVEKFAFSNAWAILQHDTRTKDLTKSIYKNKDIDLSKSDLNYSFIDNSKEDKAYNSLKQRLSEVKVQNRADVKVLCSWVVTLPEDVKNEDEHRFFESTYNFMCEKYGKQNIISADVHYDESRPHLHCTFVPVVKNTAKSKSPFAYKVSAKEVLTKKHLKAWHAELSEHVEADLGYKVSVITNTTTRNKSVRELKQETAQKLQEEIDKQKELSEIAENNAREAIEIHRKAEVLDKQNNTLETLFLSLSEQKIKRKKTGLLGTVKLSEQEYEDLCAKADAVGNLQDAYTRLRDSTTGKELERLYSINEQLEAKAEKLEAKTENLQKISQELQQENRALKEETGYLREKVSKLENWVKKAKYLTEKVWLFAYRLVKSFDEPEVKDEAINLSEELYQNSMISLGEKFTRSRSRGR